MLHLTGRREGIVVPLEVMARNLPRPGSSGSSRSNSAPQASLLFQEPAERVPISREGALVLK